MDKRKQFSGKKKHSHFDERNAVESSLLIKYSYLKHKQNHFSVTVDGVISQINLRIT